MKKRIAVFFGGRSPEHDVSIITGLQMLHALNTQKYSAFPVYLDRWGAWLVGPGLDQRKNYFPHAKMRSSLMPVLPDIASRGFGRLLPQTGGLFGKPKAIEFDVALMAFHGLHGEDGPMQGVWHLANVAYTGPRVLDAGIAMDKLMTKRIARNANVPVLPDVCIR
ncbi:MAG: D-alanine--D-alanine ligase, partial [Alphaproteobacteria bacterium]|nr:D-alanine--D-alanine ligase [Alphaproteobacteria bacterium]